MRMLFRLLEYAAALLLLIWWAPAFLGDPLPNPFGYLVNGYLPYVGSWLGYVSRGFCILLYVVLIVACIRALGQRLSR